MKKKVKEYEFKNLMELKESKNGSKMRDLYYEKLEAQEYLKELDVNEAKTVFKFRVRMAKFSGNFKGQGLIDLCPLCALHLMYRKSASNALK